MTLDEIERHLLDLRGGNQADNMERLRRFGHYFRCSLSERDFFNLVFLQSAAVALISPPQQDRRLEAVARRAVGIVPCELAANWDLGEVLRRSRHSVASGSNWPALVLCEARDGEQQFGPWYLQDGAHRALGLAMLMLLGETRYITQEAYFAATVGLDVPPNAD